MHIAEYWEPDKSWVIRPTSQGGAGFDAAWQDGLRGAIRGAIRQAAGGRDAPVDLDSVRDQLYPPWGFPAAWKSVQHVENHDLVYAGRDARVSALADSRDARSWYARSRANSGFSGAPPPTPPANTFSNIL